MAIPEVEWIIERPWYFGAMQVLKRQPTKVRLRLDLRPWEKFGRELNGRAPKLINESRVLLAEELGRMAVFRVQEWINDEVDSDRGDAFPISYTGALAASITYRVSGAGTSIQISSTSPYAMAVDQVGMPPGFLGITKSDSFRKFPGQAKRDIAALVQSPQLSRRNRSDPRLGSRLTGYTPQASAVISWIQGKLNVQDPRLISKILNMIDTRGVAPRFFFTRALRSPEYAEMFQNLVMFRFNQAFQNAMPKGDNAA